MSRLDTYLAVLVCLAFGIGLAATVPASPAMGWDESMHVAWPAANFAFAVRAGEIGHAADALLGCAQYPPVWPATLGTIEFVFGVGERLARVMTSLAWAGALAFVVLLARAAARSRGTVDPRAASWVAFAFGILCPLAASFAGTLFLEVPSALSIGFALWAWLRRKDAPSARRELVAGVAITLALFTKWNYGLLLGAALAVDWTFELVAAVRSGKTRTHFARTRTLVAVPFLACVWWFVLPLPGGFAVAAEHRAAFAGFLAGNLGATPASAADRLLYAATGIGTTVRLGALVLVAALVALRGVRTPATRALLLAATFLLTAPLVHPFFLDRFLVPGLVPVFALAGVGLASVLPSAGLPRTVAIGSLALLTLVAPDRDGVWLADRLGRLPEKEPARAYVASVLVERARLGVDRRLPTGGLERAEHDALIELVAGEIRPGERVGWIGMSSEMSPAVLRLGLAAREGAQTFEFEPGAPELDLTYFGEDPGFDDADLRAYAARFDVILWTDPIDLRERRERGFMTAYVNRLLESGRYDVRELGVVPVSRPLRAPLEVRLLSCRSLP